MQHPVWVNSRGKAFRGPDPGFLFTSKALRDIALIISQQTLKPQTIIMNENDYLDIVKWGNST